MWDLYLVGAEKHQFLVNEFLQKNGNYLHAMELNGLRHWDENRATRRLAEKWNMLLISAATVTAWNERQHQFDQRDQLYRVCARDPAGEEERHALYAAVRRAMETSHLAVGGGCGAGVSGVSAGVADLGRSGLSSRRERRDPAGERALPGGAAPRVMRYGVKLCS